MALPAEAFEALLRRAETYDEDYSLEALEALLAPELATADELANVLVSGHGSLPAFGSVDELSDAIVTAAHADDVEQGAERFARLFRASAAVAIGKLLSLRTEVERRVLATHLITDVRPAFGIEEDEEDLGDVVGTVVTHTLRIDAVHSGTVESTYVGIDDKQLDELLRQAQRALRKSERLAARLASTGLPMLKQL